MKIYGYQWSEFDPHGLVNFGDLLTEQVFRQMGYEYAPMHECPPGGKIVLAIGTILDKRWIPGLHGSLPPMPWREIHVWGSGYKWDRELITGRSDIEWHAVRGPVTRDTLGLPFNITLGDPAILMRNFDTKGPHEPIWVPHHSKGSKVATSRFSKKLVSPISLRKDVLKVCDKIASAEFVMCGSLHAAIIAQVCRIPWARWSGMTEELSGIKWQDWAQFLGLGCILPVETIEEGQEWWSCTGRNGKLSSTQKDRLISAFPRSCVY